MGTRKNIYGKCIGHYLGTIWELYGNCESTRDEPLPPLYLTTTTALPSGPWRLRRSFSVPRRSLGARERRSQADCARASPARVARALLDGRKFWSRARMASQAAGGGSLGWASLPPTGHGAPHSARACVRGKSRRMEFTRLYATSSALKNRCAPCSSPSSFPPPPPTRRRRRSGSRGRY